MLRHNKKHFVITALIVLVVGVISILDYYSLLQQDFWWIYTEIPWIPLLVTLMGLKMLFYSVGFCETKTIKKSVRKPAKKKTKKRKR